MTYLETSLKGLKIDSEIARSGRWARLRGERCSVYVVEVASGTRYYAWCDAPTERSIAVYDDPIKAIAGGLERARNPTLAPRDGLGASRLADCNDNSGA